ncbi:MAG: flavin reductase family protein [Neptuniibacter sp.]
MNDLVIQSNKKASVVERISADLFKQGMRRLAGAVNIISVEKDGDLAGLTATAVMSVSAEPPRVMVCINKDVFAHSLLREGGRICINTLSSSQVSQAKIFAGMDKNFTGVERFNTGSWLMEAGKAPQLEGALLNLQCEIVEMISASSHSMVLCEVIGLSANQDSDLAALVYFDCGFSVAQRSSI